MLSSIYLNSVAQYPNSPAVFKCILLDNEENKIFSK